MSKANVHAYPEWADEVIVRTQDLCPECGNSKKKATILCADCSREKGLKKKYVHKRKDEHFYCQSVNCPNRLKEYEKEVMVQYPRGKLTLYFCSKECLDNFAKT